MAAKTIRANKKYFLEKFKADGFYLIDSLDTPFEKKYTTQQKESLLRNGQKELLEKITNLCTSETKVILIAAPVYRANFSFLLSNGVNVINKSLVDFPGSGGQRNFKEKFSALIK